MAEDIPKAEDIPQADGSPDIPKFRYTNLIAREIEKKWQKSWEKSGVFFAANPNPPYLDGDGKSSKGKQPYFVMDMFPYPSGAGLHVGHPLGYIATDIMARYHRHKGENVLYALGFDAFGLPAEIYASETGQHPKVTTERNIEIISKQLGRLGLSHDSRREFATIDPDYVKWSQWIFLQLFNSWYDKDFEKHGGAKGSARPIAELVKKFRTGFKLYRGKELDWDNLSAHDQEQILNEYRLAYLSKTPVNWAPGLGTVVSNEEVGADGLTLRGNMPVFQKPLKQWSMRITAYSQRLIDGLDDLDWPDKVKAMQTNWIGKSVGAKILFPVLSDGLPRRDAPRNDESDIPSVIASGEAARQSIEVFTTRPDTLFGATFLVVAPEHPLLADVPDQWPADVLEAWKAGAKSPREAIANYKIQSSITSALERQIGNTEKTGVFTGLYALNQINGEQIPIFTADYVLMSYGSGAIMAVPGGDQRDFEFAKAFDLPIIFTVQPNSPDYFDEDSSPSKAYTDDGAVINSKSDTLDINGLNVTEAKAAVIQYLTDNNFGSKTVNFKIRDWLFSRQRYWGEPFPIIYDSEDLDTPIAIPSAMLPIQLPDVADYKPKTFDPQDSQSNPQTPLSRDKSWLQINLDLGNGKRQYIRDANVMPNWAGSCWYYMRYADPHFSPLAKNPAGVIEFQESPLIEKDADKYWLGPEHNEAAGKSGGVDLYVGGVEHAVLHLLYSRFWHKVLYDLGYVSSPEPFHKLFNQGYIQAYAYRNSRGGYVPAEEVKEVKPGEFEFNGEPVIQEYGKIGKSLKNVVSPDQMCDEYGADTFRLYEMSMGPLDISRPWETRAVIGPYRFLQRLWRNALDEESGDVRVQDIEPSDETKFILNRVIFDVNNELEAFRPNTAIARLIELNNHLTVLENVPRAAVENLLVMLSPFAPHIAEELWEKLGHSDSITKQPFPQPNPKYLKVEQVTAIIQVNGKLRATLDVPPDISESELESIALSHSKITEILAGAKPKKVITKPPKVVSIVI